MGSESLASRRGERCGAPNALAEQQEAHATAEELSRSLCRKAVANPGREGPGGAGWSFDGAGKRAASEFATVK